MRRLIAFIQPFGFVLFLLGSEKPATAQTAALQQQALFSGTNDPVAVPPVKQIYDEDAKSWYAVYTTGSTVHVYLAITDPDQQKKCILNGIELWFDGKGKKNKKTGIWFPFTGAGNKPGPAHGTSDPAAFNNREMQDTFSLRALATAIAGQHEMKLTGFKEDLNGIQNIHHPSGIDVALYFRKDTLVYEAQLPLNTLAEPLLLNSRISVGIIEKGMSLPGMIGGEMPPPDGGGPGDGMMPPPGLPGGAAGMRIFEDNIIWHKLLLQGADTGR